MYVNLDHEPHEGDDYVVINLETVCKADRFDGGRCANDGDTVIDGVRYCCFHAGVIFPETLVM